MASDTIENVCQYPRLFQLANWIEYGEPHRVRNASRSSILHVLNQSCNASVKFDTNNRTKRIKETVKWARRQVDKTNALLTKVLDGIHRQSEQVMNGNETRDGPGNGNPDVEFYWSLTGTIAKCCWASGTT